MMDSRVKLMPPIPCSWLKEKDCGKFGWDVYLINNNLTTFVDEMIKSHLLIQDKFLGALLYLKDKKGRGYLKLSFKNKIEGFIKGTNISTTLPVPARLDQPISLDVSYKFPDNLLEVKKIVNGKIKPEFYKAPMPIESCLFIIKLKDWQQLDTATQPENPLVLTPPSQSGRIAIVFSFLGTNGQPYKPEEYDFPQGMGVIDIPENPLDKFCIGIAEDPKNTSINGFEICIPFPKQTV
jgi:hypothetical protein